MSKKAKRGSIDRREFIKLSTATVILSGSMTDAMGITNEPIHRNERSTMTYQKLGRTNFMSSRLVFGCGAALTGGKAVRLLDRAFEAGINHFDNGSDSVYKESERSLAPFMRAHRDDIWVASKAPPGRLAVGESVTREKAVTAASTWTRLLDRSLADLQTEYVDAYYLMAVENPTLVRSEEMYQAFLDARSAGKVGYFGLSTHKNASRVLEAAIETGWYDVVTLGITPGGWYDWTTRELEKDTPTLIELQSLLKRARDAGIGLVGMKVVRFLAAMNSSGKGDPTAFDRVYDENFKLTPLNPFQRALAYTLEHGLDVVNADMQNFTHLEENIVAAATSHQYFAPTNGLIMRVYEK